MKYCELGEAPKYASNPLGFNYCLDHKNFASHCGPDGDTPVCVTFAAEDGCCCCPENYNRDEKNRHLHKAAWDRLSPDEQDELKRQFESDQEEMK
jgi:hypothetical protein